MMVKCKILFVLGHSMLILGVVIGVSHLFSASVYHFSRLWGTSMPNH